MKKVIVLAGTILALASVAAYAQMQHRGEGLGMPMHMSQGHMMGQGQMMGQGHMMPGGGAEHGAASRPKGDAGPSSLAFHGINQKMHAAMDIAFTGNADADFVRGMIPHHQGAIDMAKTVLAFGKDPEVRKLAEEIVKAQEDEIAFMQNWLKKIGQ